MIIDPSKTTRKIVEVCLHRVGVPCVGFESGEVALARWQEEVSTTPRIIFLEWDMEGRDQCHHMSSSALLRFLRAQAQWNQTALILFGAPHGAVERLVAQRRGVNDFLNKPFVRQTFLSVVNRYIPLVGEDAFRPARQVTSSPLGGFTRGESNGESTEGIPPRGFLWRVPSFKL